jgi:hypothetical protein
MNAVEIITFLRNNVIQGTRLQVTPYYKDNTLMVKGVFRNSNIQIENAEIIKEKDLIDTEDYRLHFDVNGEYIVTLWYLPTRVPNLLYITEYCIERC